MKVMVLGNAESSHTLNIANLFVLNNLECEVHSIQASLSLESTRSYSESNIDMHIYDDVAAYTKKISQRVNEVDRVIAVGGHSYGLHVANLEIFVKKTLILLGTEVTHQQALRPEISASYSHYDTIVVPSYYLANKVAPFIDYNMTSLFVEPLGIQTVWDYKGVFSNGKSIPFENYFVTAKLFKWIYGHEDIIHAAALIRNALDDTNTGFVFVGGGPESEKLKVLVKEMMLESRFLFLDKVASSELVKIVDGAITCIYPSEYESYGLSLAEAIARGKKPIVYNIPGFREVTNDYKLSISVEHNDINELSKMILKCLQAPSFCKQSSNDFNLESFSWRNLGLSYTNACLGFKKKQNQKKVSVNLFLHKHNIFNIQQRKRNFLNFEQKKIYELYREFERQNSLVHISMQNPKRAWSIIKGLDFDAVNVIYIEHGNTYSRLDRKFDEKIFAIAKKKNIRVVYFLNEYAGLCTTYLKKLKHAFPVFWLYSFIRRKQLNLLRRSQHITLALPSLSANNFFNFDDLRLLELPFAYRGGKLSRLQPIATDEKWTFVYRSNGVGGKFLYNFLLGCKKANNREVSFYIEKANFLKLSFKYQAILAGNNIKLFFDQNITVNTSGCGQVGIMPMESTDWIDTFASATFFNYLEEGMPVLAYENTEVGFIVKKYKLGWVINPSLESIFKFSIEKVFELPDFEERRASYLSNNKWEHRVKSILGTV